MWPPVVPAFLQVARASGLPRSGLRQGHPALLFFRFGLPLHSCGKVECWQVPEKEGEHCHLHPTLCDQIGLFSIPAFFLESGHSCAHQTDSERTDTAADGETTATEVGTPSEGSGGVVLLGVGRCTLTRTWGSVCLSVLVQGFQAHSFTHRVRLLRLKDSGVFVSATFPGIMESQIESHFLKLIIIFTK